MPAWIYVGWRGQQWTTMGQIALVDDAAREHVARWGGIDAICVPHPHFYGACVEWADAFDARALIPSADRQWIQRPSSRVERFAFDRVYGGWWSRVVVRDRRRSGGAWPTSPGGRIPRAAPGCWSTPTTP